MKFEEIEATFNGMEVLDHAKLRPKKVQTLCGLSRLESDREFAEWIAYTIADMQREKYTKKFLKPYQKMKVFGPENKLLTGLDYYIYQMVKCTLCRQPSGFMPYVFQSADYKGDDCGSFTTDKTLFTQSDVINHHRPYTNCENICYYNLDTHELRQWNGGELKVDMLKKCVRRRPPSPFPKTRHYKLTKTEIKNLCKKFVG